MFKTIGSGLVNSSGHFTITTKTVTLGATFYIAMSVASRPYADAFTKIGAFSI